MSNTITRTINTAIISFVVANTETMTLEKRHVDVVTSVKITDNDAKKAIVGSLGENEALVKVTDVVYKSDLYEMSLETFKEYANYVGVGRVTLE